MACQDVASHEDLFQGFDMFLANFGKQDNAFYSCIRLLMYEHELQALCGGVIKGKVGMTFDLGSNLSDDADLLVKKVLHHANASHISTVLTAATTKPDLAIKFSSMRQPVSADFADSSSSFPMGPHTRVAGHCADVSSSLPLAPGSSRRSTESVVTKCTSRLPRGASRPSRFRQTHLEDLYIFQEQVEGITLDGGRKRTKFDKMAVAMWRFLEQPADGGLLCRVFHMAWAVLIFGSVGAAIALEMPLPSPATHALQAVEVIATVLFALELAIKLVCCPHRLGFIKNAYTVIDVVVIVQGIVQMILGRSTMPLLTLFSTVAPILRLLKIARHSSGWALLMIACRRCREPLLIPLYLLLLIITFAGSLLYWVEANSSDGGAFLSIPHAMWFVVVTISTVGYGDVTPSSYAGKCIGALLIVAGVGYLAMPLAIISQQFGNVWNERRVLLVLGKLRNNMGGTVDVEALKAVFDKYQNDEGEITFDQFVRVVESLDLFLTRREIREIFGAVDLDGSGNITFVEFEEFLSTDVDTS